MGCIYGISFKDIREIWSFQITIQVTGDPLGRIWARHPVVNAPADISVSTWRMEQVADILGRNCGVLMVGERERVSKVAQCGVIDVEVNQLFAVENRSQSH